MTKKEKIENFIEKYNGYLITSLVCSEGAGSRVPGGYQFESGENKAHYTK